MSEHLMSAREKKYGAVFAPGDAVLYDAGWSRFEATFLSYGSRNMVEDRDA